MSVSPFSVQHDSEVQEYNKLRATYLAAEKQRKQEAKVMKEASTRTSKDSRAVGYDKGGRGFLKKLLTARRRTEDKEGPSRPDVDVDAKTLVEEPDWDSDQVSLKTALG
ncbi:hypothetical protein A1O1_08652 [Capronia coronata CBS 617.96]|uniref:Uncharacterized protein n=1 Tax=Capronia coronata CBS 617.96 TaxID=1182541 RepID=W9XJ17_9EURO|nr:uncharacterized protein A1O1_08652 [Capronia coronata CBS 617.96]EXJ80507.1 hypothetical protein A1O1_08652 [Capronia coronata CBS 617.96]